MKEDYTAGVPIGQTNTGKIDVFGESTVTDGTNTFPIVTDKTLAVGESKIFYFGAEITDTSNVFYSKNSYAYYIEAFSDLDNDSIVDAGEAVFTTIKNTNAANSGSYRQLYGEKLVSQNRNAILSVTGPQVLKVGETATYVVEGKTATQGYEQVVFQGYFDPRLLTINSVQQSYNKPDPNVINDRMYYDAAGWVWDPTDTVSPTYNEIT